MMNARIHPKRIPNIPLQRYKKQLVYSEWSKSYSEDLTLLSFCTCLNTNLSGIGDHNNIQNKIEIEIGRSRYPDTWNQNNDCL